MSISLWRFEVFAFLVTLSLPVVPPSLARVGLALLASGLALTPLWRRHLRATELIAVSVAVSLIGWSLATVIILPTLGSSVLAWWPVAVSLLALLASLRSRHFLRVSLDRTDLAAVIVALFVLVGVAAVYGVNGPGTSSNGAGWALRRWLQDDSLYFCALTQECLVRKGYPDENPFAAGLRNYYPSVLHCGFAGLTSLSTSSAPEVVMRIGPFVHLSAVLMLVHAMARAMRFLGKRAPAAAALVAMLVVVNRADYFVYPQTQSIVFGIVFFFFWLIAQRGWLRLARLAFTVAGLALMMAWTHTVSATAMWAGFVGYGVGKLLEKRWRTGFALLAYASIFGLLIVAVGRAPHSSAKGWTFDLRSMQFFMGYVLPHLPFYFVGLAILALRVAPVSLRFAAALLCLLGLGYTVEGFNRPDIFSRFFAIFNAQRFPYLAFWYVASAAGREWRVMKIGIPLMIAAAIFNPNPCSYECTDLVFGKRLEIGPEELSAFAFIRNHVEPRARFITNLDHKALPAFTGRPHFVHGPVMAFGMNSLPEPQQKRLLEANDEFFETLQPEERVALIEKVGIRYMLVQGTWATEEELRRWLTGFLPPNSVEIVQRWPGLVLLRWRQNLRAETRYLDKF